MACWFAWTGRSPKDTVCTRLSVGNSRGDLEDERRAFLFTNVVDWCWSALRYSGAVGAGGLGGTHALGMGRAVDEIGAAWTRAIANPIAPILVGSPRCQEVILTGDDLRRPDGGLARLPIPISTPGFDSAPYLTVTCVSRAIRKRVRNMGTYRGALKKSDSTWRAHVFTNWRRRWLSPLA